MINVILADHQKIFRIGMASALAAEDDIRVIGQPHSIDQLLSGLQKFRTHVLVLSSAFVDELADIKDTAVRHQTAILLLEDSANASLPRCFPEVNGVIQRSADESTVVKCIRRLASGESSFRVARNTSLELGQEVGLRVRRRLSPLDLRIIALVVQGFKNREIASQLGSTEQGVKNSLRKIFDKTGVSDRLELALFVLHHGMVVPSKASARPDPALNSDAALQSWRHLPNRRTVN
jgi:DNA-binding NarL/FixJ family response regulator